MATTAADPSLAAADPGIARLLKELVHLDYDAIKAYEAAIDRLEEPEFKSKLSEFCSDHRAHVEKLGAHLTAMGEEPPEGGDWKQVLTKGKVVIAEIAGDKAILIAMRANEEVTNKTYEHALEHSDASGPVRETLAANLADERRHREWLKTTIDRL